MSLLEGIDAVVFDIDGTLLHADGADGIRDAHPIPGAIETVARVRASGRRVLFFTNGTGRPPAQYAADVRAVGFELAGPAIVEEPGSTIWIASGMSGRIDGYGNVVIATNVAPELEAELLKEEV